MKAKHFVCLMLLGVFCGLRAQDTPSAIQQINAIKKNPDTYLFAESTTETWEAAVENAKFLLDMEVENYIKSLNLQDSIAGYIARANNQILQLKSMRGERYRAFLYIKKSELVSYRPNEQVLVYPKSSGSSVVSFNPSEQNSINRSAATLESSCLAEQDIDTDPEKADAISPVVLTELEKQMLSVNTGDDIGAFIRQCKKDGSIIGYGRYRDMPDGCECCLFVYNTDRQVIAYLRKTGTQYINLKTKQTDTISNYKGCGAIWIQPK